MGRESKSLLVPIIYALTLIVDVAYTFQVTSNFKFDFTASGLANLILIALIVGGIWGLENIAILYV